MRLLLSNAGLTPEDWNIACFFLNTAYLDCERDGDSLLFAEVSVQEAEKKSYYEDMRSEATAIDYQRWRVLQICRDMLALRGKEKYPDNKLKLEIQKTEKERYNTFIEQVYQKSKNGALLVTDNFQCPESGYGIFAVWDTTNSLLWFEVCMSPPWNGYVNEITESTYSWCVSQGVSACETASAGNAILYKAIGQDALTGGFDESWEQI